VSEGHGHPLITLKKLLNAGSFSGFIGHLACRHAIFLAFLRWVWPPFHNLDYCPHIFGMFGIDRWTAVC
jgi:hypothetical protein